MDIQQVCTGVESMWPLAAAVIGFAVALAGVFMYEFKSYKKGKGQSDEGATAKAGDSEIPIQ